MDLFRLVALPSCFAAYGHHLSPRIAFVFSLLSGVPKISMPHPSISLISSSNTSRSPLYVSLSPTRSALISGVLPQGHTCASTSSSSWLLVYLFFLSGRSRPPTCVRGGLPRTKINTDGLDNGEGANAKKFRLCTYLDETFSKPQQFPFVYALPPPSVEEPGWEIRRIFTHRCFAFVKLQPGSPSLVYDNGRI